MTRPPGEREPSRPSGRRPPDYVIVVSASDRLNDRYPAAAVSLSQALHGGRDPEPDLEAEP